MHSHGETHLKTHHRNTETPNELPPRRQHQLRSVLRTSEQDTSYAQRCRPYPHCSLTGVLPPFAPYAVKGHVHGRSTRQGEEENEGRQTREEEVEEGSEEEREGQSVLLRELDGRRSTQLAREEDRGGVKVG